MPKLLTLRGEVDLGTSVGAYSLEKNLFAYEAPDLTKAWSIGCAHIWLKDPKNPSVQRSEFSISLQIQTDTITPVSNNLTAGDNRAIGWTTVSYEGSDTGSSDTSSEIHRMEIIDPDHIITRNLFGTFSFNGDASLESSDCTICYLIELYSESISPTQNILQTVKSVAQDITN